MQTVFFDSQNEMYLHYYELLFAPYHHTAGATNCDHQTEISSVLQQRKQFKKFKTALRKQDIILTTH